MDSSIQLVYNGIYMNHQLSTILKKTLHFSSTVVKMVGKRVENIEDIRAYIKVVVVLVPKP